MDRVSLGFDIVYLQRDAMMVLLLLTKLVLENCESTFFACRQSKDQTSGAIPGYTLLMSRALLALFEMVRGSPGVARSEPVRMSYCRIGSQVEQGRVIFDGVALGGSPGGSPDANRLMFYCRIGNLETPTYVGSALLGP